DHEEPCGPSHKSFCLNGGLCYMIPTIPSPFCSLLHMKMKMKRMKTFMMIYFHLMINLNISSSLASSILCHLHRVNIQCDIVRKGHFQRASSVQYDINLVETSSTSAHHS
ncbi:hypothetical protein H8957_017763, partial [Semnopithecus entellus]